MYEKKWSTQFPMTFLRNTLSRLGRVGKAWGALLYSKTLAEYNTRCKTSTSTASSIQQVQVQAQHQMYSTTLGEHLVLSWTQHEMSRAGVAVKSSQPTNQ